MKKFLTLLLALVMALSLVACSASNTTQESNEAAGAVEEKKKIYIATPGDYIPFTMYDESNGEWSGIDIEIWNEIGARIGYDVEFVREDLDAGFGDLEIGRVDSVAKQISITAARKEKYDFTSPYFFSPYSLMVRADNNEISTWSDMKGKKLGLRNGSAMNEYVEELDPDNLVIKSMYESGNEIYEEIMLGRVDAMPYAYLLVKYLNEKNERFDFKAVDTDNPIYTEVNAYPFARTERGAMLLKSCNAALEEMIKDGTHAAICNKWVGYNVMETDMAKEYFNNN